MMAKKNNMATPVATPVIKNTEGSTNTPTPREIEHNRNTAVCVFILRFFCFPLRVAKREVYEPLESLDECLAMMYLCIIGCIREKEERGGGEKALAYVEKPLLFVAVLTHSGRSRQHRLRG